jgi:hypothetical protein
MTGWLPLSPCVSFSKNVGNEKKTIRPICSGEIQREVLQSLQIVHIVQFFYSRMSLDRRIQHIRQIRCHYILLQIFGLSNIYSANFNLSWLRLENIGYVNYCKSLDIQVFILHI